MLKILGIAIAGLVLYFFIDYSLEYRYWKKEQSQGISFVRGVIEDARKRNKIELENELNSIQAQFADGKTFVPYHDNVEKLAKMYILNDLLSPQSQNYYDFREKYLNVGNGLLPGCHYEFLVLLYQKETGIPQLTPSNFCQGWDELDREFQYGGSIPHARGELRY